MKHTGTGATCAKRTSVQAALTQSPTARQKERGTASVASTLCSAVLCERERRAREESECQTGRRIGLLPERCGHNIAACVSSPASVLWAISVASRSSTGRSVHAVSSALSASVVCYGGLWSGAGATIVVRRVDNGAVVGYSFTGDVCVCVCVCLLSKPLTTPPAPPPDFVVHMCSSDAPSFL